MEKVRELLEFRALADFWGPNHRAQPANASGVMTFLLACWHCKSLSVEEVLEARNRRLSPDHTLEAEPTSKDQEDRCTFKSISSTATRP
jgi:hypothetical protein